MQQTLSPSIPLPALFFFSLLCSSLPLQASLKEMARELIEKSASLEESKARKQLAQLDEQSLLAQQTWKFFYSWEREDSQLESNNRSAIFFPSGQTRSQILGFSKDFSFGGNLGLINRLSQRESSMTPSSHLFSQELSYTQDLGRNFLGRNFQKNLEKSRLNHHWAWAAHQEEVQKNLLQLVEFYLQARLNLALVELQKEAQQRAQKRLKLVKRWVRDGLRRRVDLYQAEAGLYDQQEKIKLAQLQLESARERLAKIIHRQIALKEISSLYRSQKRACLPQGKTSSNKNLKALDLSQQINRVGWEKSQFDLWPEIHLSVGYKTDGIDPTRSQALSEGMLGGDQDQTKIALNLSWPLGSRPQSLEKAKMRINLEKSKNHYQKTKLTLRESAQTFQKQIALLNKNIASARHRLRLSQKALNEQNKLYAKGRVNLDQVIRSEEALIGTNISHVNYLAQRERLVHHLSYLFGQLKDFILDGCYEKAH